VGGGVLQGFADSQAILLRVVIIRARRVRWLYFVSTCVVESTLTRPTRAGAQERRLRPNQERAWHRPQRWPRQFYRANCDVIPRAEWENSGSQGPRE
jgi:hypothetical protein